MTLKRHKEREFIEKIMMKNFFSKEKGFMNKTDVQKKKLVCHREDLSPMPLMSEEEKNKRKEKIEELCGHFSTIAIDRDDENLFAFWPQFFNNFMTPKLFDLIPASWFTMEFGFCFACKHFKGHKKGHHKLFHLLRGRKVISLFGRCEEYKNRTKKITHNKQENADIVSFNNHVMPTFRCKGWEPSKLYEQILRHRIYNILTDKRNRYNIYTFEMDVGSLTLYSFMDESDKFNRDNYYF